MRHNSPDQSSENHDVDDISKSQRKRDMQALQALGEKMTRLRPDQVATLPISERLAEALEEAARITRHEARRRHMHYIGKILRNEEDPDTLARTVAAFDAGSEEHTRRLHLAERWRERLLEGDNQALTEFIAYCPSADVQHLRNLIRNARQELAKGKSTGQTRKLFRYLRECIDDSDSER